MLYLCFIQIYFYIPKFLNVTHLFLIVIICKDITDKNFINTSIIVREQYLQSNIYDTLFSQIAMILVIFKI